MNGFPWKNGTAIDSYLVANGIGYMENYLKTSLSETEQLAKEELRDLIREINSQQGDDIRRFYWHTIHFVRSGYLLKLKYALRCFVERDFPYFAYKLATEL